MHADAREGKPHAGPGGLRHQATARGVGPETAGRILAKQSEGHDAFLRAIMEAEISYARTRQFWS